MSRKLFRHRYGGIYEHVSAAKSTVDASSVEVYLHLWPFESGLWVRPSDQFWDGRFSPITVEELESSMSGDRAEAQALVRAAKVQGQPKPTE